MSMDAPSVPPRRRGPGYPAGAIAVMAVVAVGALLGGMVLPQYLGMHPVFSAQPALTASPGTAPAPSVGGTIRVESEESVIINVVKQVRPAVVNINTESQVQTVFGVFPQQGAGSGVIVRPDGYILTNNHVVQDATTIKVTLTGGKTLTGKIIGRDPLADLAVIKVDSRDPLPAARLGSSGALQVGQLAIAIGNPFGLGSTVTTGVVSALNRNIDSSGAVVGMNTAIIPNAQGIGFAIPSDVARVEMEQLIANGRVIRPWVGVVYGGEVDPQSGRAYNLGTEHGVLVRQVEPSGPAARAGVQPGDIITAVNRDRVGSWNDFVRDIVGKKIGETITLSIVRDHAPRTLSVTLAERPAGSP